MKNELEYLKEAIKDFSIEELAYIIRNEPLIKGKEYREIFNNEQKRKFKK